jgi:peptide/nickel transport system ATP-binding protein
MPPLLTVDSLTVEYRASRGNVRAVDDIAFSLKKGEILGVVGESGSGKSTLGLSLIRQVPPPGVVLRGSIKLNGQGILSLQREKMRLVRGRRIAFVFQDPMTSLNPVKSIGEHFIELLRTHEPNLAKTEALGRTNNILKVLGISPERIKDYPHQFSGGMRQRIMIGLGIALNPDLVIADEPTTALDVIVQAKILDLLKKLRDTYGMALILITHDLSIALERCDKIIVMYAGQIAEQAKSRDIQERPRHPYTQGLMRSIPNIELADQRLEAIPGSPPDLLNLPKGCRFNPRCPYAMPYCSNETPLMEVGKEHFVRCFLYGG